LPRTTHPAEVRLVEYYVKEITMLTRIDITGIKLRHVFGVGRIAFAVLLAMSAIPQARADFSLGDAANFAVLYEGNGQQLQFNNSNVTGNIGIGAINGTSGSFQGNGPGTITGTVEFNNSSGSFSNSGLTITGNGGMPLFGQTNIDTDLTNLNSLSQMLSTESGTSVNIAAGGSLSATSGILDGNGNRVFTGTINSNFTVGTTFTINGSASDFVVINIPNTGGQGFNGSIVLTGGITSDHVLINFTAGNYSNQTGGQTLTISTNGNVTMGTFLNPNGNIQINHSLLDGRLFGGDTQNLAIVSGAEINAPTPAVPEPASVLLLGTVLLACAAVMRRHKSSTGA
jgi:PEP-CTERM motif